MISTLQFIFGEMDTSTLTPIMLVAFYMFVVLVECISSIFHSTLKVGGLN